MQASQGSRDMSAEGARVRSAIPPTVTEVVRSSGQPLDNQTQAEFGPVFGFDFSRVRIHADALGAKSAQSVGALAYAVGRHVVFGQGQYAPGTRAGRALIAHELTHVVQQGAAEVSMQDVTTDQADSAYEHEAKRIGSETVDRSSLQSPNDALRIGLPTLQRAGDPTAIPPTVGCPPATTSPPTVSDAILFPNNVSVLSGADRSHLESFVTSWWASGATDSVRIDGFASTPGGEPLNWRLSCERAENVAAELAAPTSGAVAGIPASFLSVFMHGETAEFGSEAANRQVTLALEAPAPTPVPTPVPLPVPIPTPIPTNICGPDITRPLAAVLADVRSTFSSWSPTQKREACDAITGLTSFVMAWDIHELFLPETGWLCAPPYHPPCGMPPLTGCDSEDPSDCGNSVEVSGKCFLAGTVNYVLLGQICRLCNDEFGVLSESTMVTLVDLWKALSLFTDDPGPPKAWARAGFHGFPGFIPVAENRGDCKGRCGIPYSSGAFTWVWEPHQPR